MESKINRKLGEYFLKYKKHITAHSLETKRKILELCEKLNFESNDLVEVDKLCLNLIMIVQNYSPLVLTNSDFVQRKRVKSIVPEYERCTACRADGTQCTRRKKDQQTFCGTHLKGTPHGTISNDNSSDLLNLEKVSIQICDINGILYYIDSNNNVYNSEDIMSNKTNPRVIAKYSTRINPDQTTSYMIPEFN